MNKRADAKAYRATSAVCSTVTSPRPARPRRSPAGPRRGPPRQGPTRASYRIRIGKRQKYGSTSTIPSRTPTTTKARSRSSATPTSSTSGTTCSATCPITSRPSSTGSPSAEKVYPLLALGLRRLVGGRQGRGDPPAHPGGRARPGGTSTSGSAWPRSWPGAASRPRPSSWSSRSTRSTRRPCSVAR